MSISKRIQKSIDDFFNDENNKELINELCEIINNMPDDNDLTIDEYIEGIDNELDLVNILYK